MYHVDEVCRYKTGDYYKIWMTEDYSNKEKKVSGT